MARPMKQKDAIPLGRQTAKARYDILVPTRQPFLDRAREASSLTIPSLLPPEGSDGMDLEQPFQSVGADGVINLAAKLQLVLFPPGEPFAKTKVNPKVLDALAAKAGDEAENFKTQIDEALAKMEKLVCESIENAGSRQVNYEALVHEIVAGNALVHMHDDGTETLYTLPYYVVKRDRKGTVLDIVVKECIDKVSAPPEVLEILEVRKEDPEYTKATDEDEIELYTWVKRQPNGSWKVHQEVLDVIVEGSQGSYPKDKCAWLPLRWTSVAGEDYGRGRCEEYIGDLRSLEEAEKSIITFAAVCAKVVALVNEGGTTQKAKLAEAESGDIIEGDVNDVKFLQVEKSHDFSIVAQVAEDKRKRLERAFLLATSIQRNAERVTAEEIRALMGEIQAGLGGTYAIQAAEFQRPLFIRRHHQMEKKGELPKLPDGVVSFQVVTGLDGLGRNADMQKLDLFIAGIAQVFGAPSIAQWVNVGEYLKRRGTALGIDLKGLVKSSEEVAQENQQAQQQALMEKAIGPGINAASSAMATQGTAPQEAAVGSP